MLQKSWQALKERVAAVLEDTNGNLEIASNILKHESGHVVESCYRFGQPSIRIRDIRTGLVVATIP